MVKKSDANRGRDQLSGADVLDWKEDPAHFDRLCEDVISLFAKRDGLNRKRLFGIVSEHEFRDAIKASAEKFTKRSRSLVAYVYMRMKFLVLPRKSGRISP